MAKLNPHGFIYVLQEEGNPEGFYKIGLTEQYPTQRYSQYQTGNARTLEEVAVFPFAKTEVAQIERVIHGQLRGRRVPGPSREWFKLTDQELDKVLGRIFNMMQAEWKEYMRRDDITVFATWCDSYRYGTLPIPAWLLERKQPPSSLPEWMD